MLPGIAPSYQDKPNKVYKDMIRELKSSLVNQIWKDQDKMESRQTIQRKIEYILNNKKNFYSYKLISPYNETIQQDEQKDLD